MIMDYLGIILLDCYLVVIYREKLCTTYKYISLKDVAIRCFLFIPNSQTLLSVNVS